MDYQISYKLLILVRATYKVILSVVAVKACIRDLHYNSSNLYPNWIIRHILTKCTNHLSGICKWVFRIAVAADMQTPGRPRQAPTHMLGGQPNTSLLLYMPFVYLVRSSDSSEVLCFYCNMIYFSHSYVHWVRPEAWYTSYDRLDPNITSLYSRDRQIPILPLSTTLSDN